MDGSSRPDASPPDAPPARSSTLARGACVAWVAMTIYASLTPWSEWQDRGISPWSYLAAPWPRHVTAFDLVVNVAGYLPLGATLALALYPRLRGAWAVAAATLAGIALSTIVEGVQTYLPARVASNVDVLTNSAGTLLGAVLFAPLAPAIIDRGRILQWRRRWFRTDETLGLVLAALWPLAQAHPGSTLFGLGRWDAAPEWIATWLLGDADPGRVQVPLVEASDFVLAESAITIAGLLAAGLGFAALLQRRAPRLALLAAWVGAALAVKIIAYGVAFDADDPFGWMTRGAAGGLLLGGFTLLAASLAPARFLPPLAAWSTVALLALVNALPENPYHEAWVEQWQPGHLRNLVAAAQWLASTWPLAWLAWLAWTTFRRRDAGTRRGAGTAAQPHRIGTATADGHEPVAAPPPATAASESPIPRR